MNTATTFHEALEGELRELGLTAAADEIKTKKELKRKLRIAFEHFRVVTPEHIARFNTELRTRTERSRNGFWTYDRLKFTNLREYQSIPPALVLEALRAARAHQCFDGFEVAEIDSVQVIPDPVLFGRIIGNENRYFIAQWDDDVKIEDILRENEG